MIGFGKTTTPPHRDGLWCLKTSGSEQTNALLKVLDDSLKILSKDMQSVSLNISSRLDKQYPKIESIDTRLDLLNVKQKETNDHLDKNFQKLLEIITFLEELSKILRSSNSILDSHSVKLDDLIKNSKQLYTYVLEINNKMNKVQTNQTETLAKIGQIDDKIKIVQKNQTDAIAKIEQLRQNITRLEDKLNVIQDNQILMLQALERLHQDQIDTNTSVLLVRSALVDDKGDSLILKMLEYFKNLDVDIALANHLHTVSDGDTNTWEIEGTRYKLTYSTMIKDTTWMAQLTQDGVWVGLVKSPQVLMRGVYYTLWSTMVENGNEVSRNRRIKVEMHN